MGRFASRKPDEITAEIVRQIVGASRPLVAVDGIAGAGKSYLAAGAASTLAMLHLDLDRYVLPESARLMPGCVVNLRLEAIRHDLDSAVGGAILSGDCMRDALQRLGRDAKVHVYVKCWNAYRDCWESEDECEIATTSDVPAGVPPLHREVMEYHVRRKPHRRAAIEWHNLGWGSTEAGAHWLTDG
jgi:hypothetical protein